MSNDFEKLLNQANKSGEVAKKSAKKTVSKPKEKTVVKTPDKPKHRVKVYGSVDVRIHGGTRPTQRIIDYVHNWLEENVDKPHSVALNWLLVKGIEYAESQLVNGDLTITDGELPTKNPNP